MRKWIWQDSRVRSFVLRNKSLSTTEYLWNLLTLTDKSMYAHTELDRQACTHTQIYTDTHMKAHKLVMFEDFKQNIK